MRLTKSLKNVANQARILKARQAELRRKAMPMAVRKTMPSQNKGIKE